MNQTKPCPRILNTKLNLAFFYSAVKKQLEKKLCAI